MYKVILFDLDGTLTDKNKNILEETLSGSLLFVCKEKY